MACGVQPDIDAEMIFVSSAVQCQSAEDSSFWKKGYVIGMAETFSMSMYAVTLRTLLKNSV